MLVRSHDDLDDLLEKLVSVRASTVGTLVERRVGVELDYFALDALRNDLTADCRIFEHLVTVDVDEHCAATALDHLLAFYYVQIRSHYSRLQLLGLPVLQDLAFILGAFVSSISC